MRVCEGQQVRSRSVLGQTTTDEKSGLSEDAKSAFKQLAPPAQGFESTRVDASLSSL